jgi:hypothetical protein
MNVDGDDQWSTLYLGIASMLLLNFLILCRLAVRFCLIN